MSKRACTKCGKVCKSLNMQPYWIGNPRDFNRGYLCPRCIAYSEHRGEAFDIAHDPRYAHIMMVGTEASRRAPGLRGLRDGEVLRLQEENHQLSLLLFDAEERLKAHGEPVSGKVRGFGRVPGVPVPGEPA